MTPRQLLIRCTTPLSNHARNLLSHLSYMLLPTRAVSVLYFCDLSLDDHGRGCSRGSTPGRSLVRLPLLLIVLVPFGADVVVAYD